MLRTTIEIVGAGRTDSGVHAKQLYAHFDHSSEIDCSDLSYRLNAFLPDTIAVKKIFEVHAEAHARFDATSRSYEYWIVQEKNPFFKDTAHFIREPLNFEAMNAAAKLLLDHNDFECFSKSNTDVKTFLCKIEKANWIVQDDKMVFTITADRFLRNMVRAIVGTLLEIGRNKKPIDWMTAVIESKNRSDAGASVPAKGLYLTKVEYPDSIHK